MKNENEAEDFNFADWQAKELSKYAYPGRMHGMIGGFEQEIPIQGMTKREAFAMAAMQGIISGFDPETKCNGCYIPASEYPHLMIQAVQIADELLKQLEIQKP